MALHDGFYELMRDSMEQPDFWTSIGNTCLPHFHATIELAYVETGYIDALLNGKHYRAAPGEIIVVPSYTTHSFSAPEDSRSFELQIPLAYIRRFHEISSKRTFVETVIPNTAPAQEIARHLQSLFSEKPNDFVVRGAIYSILGILMDTVPMQEIEKNNDHKKICNILSYLQQNYQHPILLDTLASEFGYSRSRFSYIFNKNIGCSIPEYINMLRSSKAASLLLDEDLSITDAAMAAGFESTRTFYRAFSAQYGMSPSEYLERSCSKKQTKSQQ